ncbi:DASH complex subunit dad2 [Savitreella phatthalungensis]
MSRMSRPSALSARASGAHATGSSQSQLGNSTHGASNNTGGGGGGIAARIAAKQAEYEALLQLKQQSDALLKGMRQLEGKLSTLNDGTAQVAGVLANWANVFRAINLTTLALQHNNDDDDDGAGGEPDRNLQMPETLVRIPVETGASTTTGNSS